MLFSILFVVIPIGVYCQIDPSLTECGMVPLYHGDIPDEYAVIFTEDFTHPQVEDILAPIVGDGFEIDTIYCNFRNSWAVVTVTDVDRMEMVRLLPTVLFVQGVYRLTVSENWGQDRINQRETKLDGNSTISRCQVTKICPATESPNIYILDTGIRYSHEEFGGRAAFAYDFLASENQNGFDTHGHGTKVAAVAAGKTYGLAKNAYIWSVRISNIDGVIDSKGLWNGLLFVFNNGKTPAVINLSINSVTPDILDAFSKLIIRNVLKKRIPIVSSAGNNNDDAGNYYPADSGMVMVVGATDENDKRAPDSNFGPSIDFFAPGVNIETAGIGSDTETVTTSGTSMAAAFVSGLAGLVKTQVPGSTQEEVAHRIGYYSTKDVVDDVNGSPNRLFYACHP